MGAPAQANGLNSWKQVGQDLGRQPTDTRGQILNWQTAQDTPHEATKSPSKINAAKPAEDKKEEGDKKAAHIVLKDATVPKLVSARPSPAKLNKDVKDATTPKKRVVSDEHWRQTRKPATTPQSAPQAARQIIPEDATHGFYKTTGSPNYDAWVRKRRKSPPRSKSPKETVPLDLKPEDTDPLNLLYWMTGKQKTDFKQTQPRPQAASPPRYEIKYSTKEPQPREPARTTEEIRRQPVTTVKSQDLPVSRKSSPVSSNKSIEVKPQGRSGNKIESWLGNSSDPFGHDSDSSASEEDFSPTGMFAKYPTLRKRAGAPPRGRHQRDDHIKDDRRDKRGQHVEEEDYFSTSRMPRHRLDEHDDFESEVTSPLSPNSLRRRGAKRHGKSPRKAATSPPSPVIDRSSDLAESVLSEGETATIYSTIENDRHGPIKYVKRHAPVLVDIPSRRVPSESFDGVSPSSARKVPESTSRSILQTSNSRPTVARKITTETDLMSVLSLPHPDQHSFPKARTVQESVDVKDVLADLRADEEQYVDELKTLVDGVIPVLLSSVLSKNDSKDMAGVFSSSPAVPAATNAIVNIGVALERLKGCHYRLPTTNVIALLLWAETTAQVYEDYLKAWRLGFQDVVVNLAPTSQGQRSTSTSTVTPGSGKAEGKQVNVAYLLKRPLVRLKYLTRSIKAIGQAEDSKLAASCVARYQDLLSLAKRRQDEERARLEDDAAAAIDSTRAREPRTLASIIGVKIDPGRCVRARDFFTLQMQHSSGQCIDCSVEIILRDDKSIPGTGDVLVCEVGSGSKWLLFPPIQLSKTSARLGIDLEELVVMIRGTQAGREEWHELLVLRTPDEHTVRDWHRMLGSTPMPPAVHQPTTESKGRATGFAESLSNLSLNDVDVPLGERSIVSSFVNRHDRDLDADTIRPLSGVSQRPLPLPPGLTGGRASPRIVKARSVESMSGVAYGSAPIESTPQTTIKRKAVPPRSPTASSVSMTASSVSMPTTPTRPEQRRQGNPLSSTAKPIYTPSSPTKVPPRSSSPLKHEFRPDHSSATASDFDEDFSDDDASFTSESSVDDFPLSPLEHWKPRQSETLSQAYSSSVSGSLAPSDSASQIPQGQQQPAQTEKLEKTFATVMYWSPKGHWATIARDECLIIVSPGLIEAFDIASSRNWSVGDISPGKAGIRPIVALELTPLVPLRRGTALDISVRSPPTGESRFQDGSNIMFRSRNGQECAVLYGLINQARINNPTYIAMQNGRPPAGGANWSSYMDRRPGGARNISSWWRFGSKKSSYRKGNTNTERTPSLGQRTEDSGASLSSGLSALKRFSNGRAFSLGKSTITSGAGLSKSSSSGETISEGAKSPPINMARGTPTGITNKRIRLYQRESAAKWRDMGSARLTILHPSQAAIIAPTGYLIQEKRVLITGKSGNTLLDVTLGETAFERVARTGLAVSVVEDLVGRDGVRVDVASMGGVGGSKVRVYMIQMKTEAETAYTFSLVGRLRY